MRKLALAFAIAILPSFAVAASFGHMVGHPGGRGHGAFHGFAHPSFSHRTLGRHHARIFRHQPFFVWPLYGYYGAYDVPPYGYTGTYDVPPYVPDYTANELTPNPDTIGVPPIATRSLGCQQQKVSVPSENGEMSEVTIVRC